MHSASVYWHARYHTNIFNKYHSLMLYSADVQQGIRKKLEFHSATPPHQRTCKSRISYALTILNALSSDESREAAEFAYEIIKALQVYLKHATTITIDKYILRICNRHNMPEFLEFVSNRKHPDIRVGLAVVAYRHTGKFDRHILDVLPLAEAGLREKARHIFKDFIDRDGSGEAKENASQAKSADGKQGHRGNQQAARKMRLVLPALENCLPDSNAWNDFCKYKDAGIFIQGIAFIEKNQLKKAKAFFLALQPQLNAADAQHIFSLLGLIHFLFLEYHESKYYIKKGLESAKGKGYLHFLNCLFFVERRAEIPGIKPGIEIYETGCNKPTDSVNANDIEMMDATLKADAHAIKPCKMIDRIYEQSTGFHPGSSTLLIERPRLECAEHPDSLFQDAPQLPEQEPYKPSTHNSQFTSVAEDLRGIFENKYLLSKSIGNTPYRQIILSDEFCTEAEFSAGIAMIRERLPTVSIFCIYCYGGQLYLYDLHSISKIELDWRAIMDELHGIMSRNRKVLSMAIACDADKRAWWSERIGLDGQLGCLIEKVAAAFSMAAGNKAILVLDENTIEFPFEQVLKVHAYRMNSLVDLFKELMIGKVEDGSTGGAGGKVCEHVDECVNKNADRRLDQRIGQHTNKDTEKNKYPNENTNKYTGTGNVTERIEKAFYLLDADNNLLNTRECISNLLENINLANLTGITGRRMAPQEQALLSSTDLFMYFGHGSGKKHFELKNIRPWLVFLFGCGSCRLLCTPNYRRNGCLAEHLKKNRTVLGMLWDVTDRDLDRFTAGFLIDFFSGKGLAESVRRNINACKLRHLNGASIVVYGTVDLLIR